MDVGPAELLIILAIVLLLFGSAKLPKLARSLGQAQKEFKQGMAEGQRDDEAEPPKPKPVEAAKEAPAEPPATPSATGESAAEKADPPVRGSDAT